MDPGWRAFLQGTASSHAAHVYRDAAELAESVAGYLAVGLDLGDPALVIATPEHGRAIAAELERVGWSEARVAASGLVRELDAETTLASILDDGRPSQAAFDEVVGHALDEVAARFPGRRIRAFGEMVDLLCRDGRISEAAELEALWNRLARRRSFSLLCGYGLDVFDPETQKRVLPEVCRAHSHVHPAADSARLAEAVDAALAEVLGDAAKVYALAETGLRRKEIPQAQLALMWVSSQMPQSAERIFESAREKYLAA